MCKRIKFFIIIKLYIIFVCWIYCLFVCLFGFYIISCVTLVAKVIMMSGAAWCVVLRCVVQELRNDICCSSWYVYFGVTVRTRIINVIMGNGNYKAWPCTISHLRLEFQGKLSWVNLNILLRKNQMFDFVHVFHFPRISCQLLQFTNTSIKCTFCFLLEVWSLKNIAKKYLKMKQRNNEKWNISKFRLVVIVHFLSRWLRSSCDFV